MFLPRLISSVNSFSTTTSRVLMNAASKSNLAKLRKKTGYPFALCKTALANSNQNIEDAEVWIDKNAESFGWDKAQKLEGRNTNQGLVGICVRGNRAGMLELSCETDFVSRNERFHSLLKESIGIMMDNVASMAPSEGDDISMTHISNQKLASLPVSTGGDSNDKRVGDLVAVAIARLGENIVIKRGVTFECGKHRSDGGDGFEYILAGLTHPTTSSHKEGDVQYGRYGALVAVRASNKDVTGTVRQLCQHIIGMNPLRIQSDESEEVIKSEDGEETSIHDSRTLLHQSFLLDDSISVGDFLNEAGGIIVEDFVRYEVGKDTGEATSGRNDIILEKNSVVDLQS